jgi:hypothetical protein
VAIIGQTRSMIAHVTAVALHELATQADSATLGRTVAEVRPFNCADAQRFGHTCDGDHDRSKH